MGNMFLLRYVEISYMCMMHSGCSLPILYLSLISTNLSFSLPVPFPDSCVSVLMGDPFSLTRAICVRVSLGLSTGGWWRTTGWGHDGSH